MVEQQGVPFQGDRVVRVFVSSTFRDMQEERDYLVKFVFPGLRKLCESRGVTWGEVDLRWGINDEQKAEGRILPICLEEIQRCRPFFIGILGSYYGMEADPQMANPDLLQRQPWLREHLQEGKSITELEILHGVLNDPAMSGQSFFYFRDPSRNPFPEGPGRAEKLAQLKQRIRASGLPIHENYRDAQGLGQLVAADLTAAIERRFPPGTEPGPLAQDAIRHEGYAQSRRLAFVGRRPLLEKISVHIARDAAPPLVLSGEAGCGKSALLAEWVGLWREAHPQDLVIQHYIGSTPDSADVLAIIRRILGELKAAFAIPDEVPLDPEALRLALAAWTTKAAGARRVILVLDALNQLAQADAALRLSWLPASYPANFRILVSTLPGENLDLLRGRSWTQVEVPLFDRGDIAPAACAYFALFGKTPSASLIAHVESTPLARNALFLRAVLDELRQFGSHERLLAKADEYLASPDIVSLYDLILTRWQQDFDDPEQGELVRPALCLLACARFGLSEAELLDLLGTDGRPLQRRTWTPFHLAAENALVLRCGLLNLGHQFLRLAVERRWLPNESGSEAVRRQLADYFAGRRDTFARKADELPWLLARTNQWTPLKDFLTEPQTLVQMRNKQRWELELHGYWIQLKQYHDLQACYMETLERVRQRSGSETIAHFEDLLGHFLKDCGYLVAAERLLRHSLEETRRLYGPDHPQTFMSLTALATLLFGRAQFAEAEVLSREALAGLQRTRPADDPDVLGCLANLAAILTAKKDYTAAQELQQGLLERVRRVYGPLGRLTVATLNNLGDGLAQQGRFAEAEPYYRQAVEAFNQTMGADHPQTLKATCGYGVMLCRMGRREEGLAIVRPALKDLEAALGADHPDALLVSGGIATLLREIGDLEDAEKLFRRTVATAEQSLGPLHPTTVTCTHGLAMLLLDKGDVASAAEMFRRAIEAMDKTGQASEKVLLDCFGLVNALVQLGQLAEAEPLLRRAVDIHIKARGAEHPETQVAMTMLAHLLGRLKRPAEAETVWRRLLEIRSRALPAEDPEVLDVVDSLARALLDQNKQTEALDLLRRIVEDRRRVLGPKHIDTIVSVNNLSFLLRQQGDLDGAEEALRQNLASLQKTVGWSHRETITCANNLASILQARGQLAAAAELYVQALAAAHREKVFKAHENETMQGLISNYAACLTAMGRSREQIVESLQQLFGPPQDPSGDSVKAKLERLNEQAMALYQSKQLGEMEGVLRQILDICRRELPRGHSFTQATITNLAGCLEEQGKLAEAEPLMREALEAKELTAESRKAEFALDLNEYALLLRKIRMFGRAAQVLQRAIEIEDRLLSPDHPRRPHRRNNLAVIRMMAGNLDDAWNVGSDAWRLKAAQGDVTCARILFVRISLCLLMQRDPGLYLGQLRTLLAETDLPCAGNLSRQWDAADVLDTMRQRLSAAQVEFLAALLAAINEPAQRAGLDRFQAWTALQPVPLDAAWPAPSPQQADPVVSRAVRAVADRVPPPPSPAPLPPPQVKPQQPSPQAGPAATDDSAYGEVLAALLHATTFEAICALVEQFPFAASNHFIGTLRHWAGTEHCEPALKLKVLSLVSRLRHIASGKPLNSECNPEAEAFADLGRLSRPEDEKVLLRLYPFLRDADVRAQLRALAVRSTSPGSVAVIDRISTALESGQYPLGNGTIQGASHESN